MMIELPSLSILAAVQDSQTDMFIHPSGHQLYVAVPPEDRILMFHVEENLNELTEAQVNTILQREILLAHIKNG